MLEDGKADLRQLSHDLRNHLFAIDLGLQVLEMDRMPEPLVEVLGKIRAELAAAGKIASALSDAGPNSPERK